VRDPIGRNPNFSSAPMEEITAFQIARKSTKIDRFRSRVLKRNFSGRRRRSQDRQQVDPAGEAYG
jgi:hypothetical protein